MIYRTVTVDNIDYNIRYVKGSVEDRYSRLYIDTLRHGEELYSSTFRKFFYVDNKFKFEYFYPSSEIQNIDGIIYEDEYQ